MKILVIGAGVLGLSTALNLVKDGHEVVITDKIGPYAQASNRSFAWINANHKLPAAYYELNRAGVAAHEEFQTEFASYGTWFHQNGCILFDSEDNREVGYENRAVEAQELGYPVEYIDNERLRTLEPGVNWPVDSGLFFSADGHLDNEFFGKLLETLLETAGISMRVREVVKVRTDANGASVEFADSADEQFDQVVLSAGADSGEIAYRSNLLLPVADLSKPGPRTHSFLGITAPTQVDLNRVIISDRINVRPRRDGSMFVQVPSVEHRTAEGESPELLEEVRKVMETRLNELFGIEVSVTQVIFSGRSFPEDGVSIVGYLDSRQRVYSLVTHSGMTLAPLLGRLAANEMTGQTEHLLEQFRPSRFVGGVTPAEPSVFIGKQ